MVSLVSEQKSLVTVLKNPEIKNHESKWKERAVKILKAALVITATAVVAWALVNFCAVPILAAVGAAIGALIVLGAISFAVSLYKDYKNTSVQTTVKSNEEEEVLKTKEVIKCKINRPELVF